MQDNPAILTTIPTYWQNRNQPNMRRAVEYYNRCMCGNPHSIDAKYHQEQIEAIRAYFSDYMSATCWDLSTDLKAETLELRTLISSISTIEDVTNWLFKAIQIGINPL
jgi:hypothetical protein